MILDYGHECIIPLANGKTIRTESADSAPYGVSYVRVCDKDNKELVYWISSEWAEDPEVVMGALLGACCED